MMRNEFSGYFRPTKEQFSKLFNEAIFVFDTSVLISLYETSEDTRVEFLQALKKVGQRVWLPHQVAQEYLDRRLEKVDQQSKSYQKFCTLLDSKLKDIKDQIDKEYKDHPLIDSDNIYNKIERTFSAIQKELRRKEKEHPNLITEDPILEELTKLFQDRIGLSYDVQKLKAVCKEAKERFDRSNGPGYKDYSPKLKKDDKDKSRENDLLNTYNQFGDYIIWQQMIDHAKNSKQPIIFVTNDSKEDWWHILKESERTYGPRPDLIHEFREKADVSFYMYKADPFLKQLNEHLKLNIAEKTIEGVKAARNRNESYAVRGPAELATLSALTWPKISEEVFKSPGLLFPTGYLEETKRLLEASEAALRGPASTIQALINKLNSNHEMKRLLEFQNNHTLALEDLKRAVDSSLGSYIPKLLTDNDTEDD